MHHCATVLEIFVGASYRPAGSAPAMSDPFDPEATAAWRLRELERTITKLRWALRPFGHDKATQTDNGQPGTPGRELTPTKYRRRQAAQVDPTAPLGSFLRLMDAPREAASDDRSRSPSRPVFRGHPDFAPDADD